MRFLREVLIIIIILIIVFWTERITSNELNDSVKWVRDRIISVENKVNEDKKEEAEKEFDEFQEQWKEKNEKLALFVEHNELEKISNDIVIIKSNLKSDDIDEVMEDIAELKFMLEHIEEKNQLKLKNIF